MNATETVKEATEDIPEPEKAILFLGDRGVGKTTLARALTGELFDPREAVTHGANFLKVPDFKGVRLFDFSGDADYRNTMRDELGRCEPIAALIMTDARSSDAVSNVDHWCSRLSKYKHRDGLPKFLVLTKCDVAACNIDVADLSRRYSFTGVYKTSAKDRTGIEELRSAIRIAVVGPEEEEGEVAKIVRTMADCLCELVARNPHALEEIEWRDLERLLARAIAELGFTVELTPPAKDGGKDLVATCLVARERLKYYVEIKHWRKGDHRPGRRHVEAFLALNAREETDGGLFLSSSGFTDEVYACLAEISKQRVRLGAEEKIVSLCQQYVRKRRGLWQSTTPLPELLFECTMN
jgi:hypothetical protein